MTAGGPDRPRAAWRTFRVATIPVLFLMALLYLTIGMNRNVGAYDEGVILFGAVRVMAGAIPHRDFYANYGPAQFYVLAGLFNIFGASVLVERGWDTVVRSLCVVLVFVIVARSARRRLALLFAAASLEWLRSFGAYGYPVFPCLAASLASMALLAPCIGVAGPAPRLLAAGLCSGIAMLFRYDAGLGAFGVEFVVLGASVWLRPEDGTRRHPGALMTLIRFAAGFACVTLPVAVAFAVLRAIPDLVFDVIAFPARFYGRTRSLPFPSLANLWVSPEWFVGTFGVYLPLLLCVAAVPAIVTLARGATRDRACGRSAQLWHVLAWVALSLVFYLKGVVRVSVIQLAMALIASLALTGVLAQPVRTRGLTGFGLFVAAVSAVYVFTLANLPSMFHRVAANIAWATGPALREPPGDGIPSAMGSCRMPKGFERMACFPMAPDDIAAIHYIQKRTAADEPVFVGLSRHDKIFGSNVLFYFAVGRPPATKWYHFDPGLQSSVSIQQEMIGELKRAKPEFIVLSKQWEAVAEPNDSALSSGVTLLDDYIGQAYEPVATFGWNRVMRVLDKDAGAAHSVPKEDR